MGHGSALEDEIVAWLVELIENDQLANVIEGGEYVREVAETFRQESVLPSFGIDQLSRRASTHAAETVLGGLEGLQIVSVNKSISLTKDEMLRPDILCFNPETRTFVIFEVKRDKSTEREAVSELAGYEQELRNVLPLLGQHDIHFVVVSTEWNVLLTHAVASLNTWSAKNCLALKVTASARPFSMACHIPTAWHPRGGVGLPDSAMQTIDVVFEARDQEDEVEWGSPPHTLITATHALARAGDRRGAHGFVLLWQDNSGFGKGQWAWTLCGIDPIALQDWCNGQGLASRSSALTQYLDRQVAEAPSMVPSSTIKIAEEALPILRNRYEAEFGNAFSWCEKLSILQRRALPVYFEFWGALGDHAREFVSHPGVRGRYVPYIESQEVDWTHPVVAMPLLAQISGQVPFPEGLIRCSDAFMAGVCIGIHEFLAWVSDDSESEGEKLKALLKWCMLDLLELSIEMAEIARASLEVHEPPPPVSESRKTRLNATRALAEWTLNQLIGSDHPLHCASFQLGREGAAFFSDRLEDEERSTFVEAHAEELAASLRELVAAVTVSAIRNGGGLAQAPALQQMLHRIGVNTGDEQRLHTSLAAVPARDLLIAFLESEGKALDEVIPPVLHRTLPLSGIEVDWEEVKRGIQAIHDGGFAWPAFLISQNGKFGTGRIADEMVAWLSPIADPLQEVYFLDTRASHAMAVKMTWDELQAKFQFRVQA